MQFNLINQAGERNLTVFAPGREPLVAHDTHPQFDKILQGVLNDDESVFALFDLSEIAAAAIEQLSERVSIAYGRVYFDGDEVDNALTKQIVRFVTEEQDDWKPLVRFYEKVMDNPQKHSREQLYRFLDEHNFPLTEDGDIVAYKGVQDSYDGTGVHTSTHKGVAWVDGVMHTGYTPYPIDAVVTMPRNQVAQNPTEACSAGLHVATFDYASGYGSGVLEVHVNPRDVVSVPTGTPKVRCCRLKVVQFIEREYDDVVVYEDNIDEDFIDELISEDELDDLFGHIDVVAVAEDLDAFWSDPEDSLWDRITNKAKRKKKGIHKIAEQEGLTFLGGDAKDRTNYIKVPEDQVIPSKEEFESFQKEARQKKKGVYKIAKKHGYIVVGDGDWNQRTTYHKRENAQ